MRHLSFLASSTSFSSIPAHANSASSSIFLKPSAIQSIPWRKTHFSYSLLSRRPVSSPLRSTAELHPVVEGQGIPEGSEFIEIGYICNVHGLQGELRVKPTTDFPELRFSTPGKRWLKMRISGKERIQEIELTEGRGHPGQKNWIISLGGVDTVETARQFVGSTLLVRESDRPVLEEGEFYIPDLVGMKVFLKETQNPVGTVVNVFNCGSSDLLQVRLNPAQGTDDSLQTEAASGPLVWIPFVEAIVPVVDMNKREMHITPPDGLLELNIRSDGRPKKERRKLEWKERKKMQRRLIAAKKKVNEIDQHHILQGLSFGENAQKASLASQIASLNFKLLQQAMQCLHRPPSRYSLTEFIDNNWINLLKGAVRINKESLVSYEKGEVDKIGGKGAQLVSTGKVAIVLVISDKDADSCPEDLYTQFQGFLEEEVPEVEEWRTKYPLLLVCPSNKIEAFQQLLSDHNHYGFDAEKVWFLEEEKLPVFSSSMTDGNIHKILLESPWLILQSPLGSGGVISLLTSHNMVTNFSDMGIEYVEVCTLGRRSKVGNPYFFGLVESCNADVGMKIFDDEEEEEDDVFDMIFSMPFLRKITDRIDEFECFPVPVVSSYVEMQGKEWIDVRDTSPNSYKLYCSIYSFLKACSPDRICLFQIAD